MDTKTIEKFYNFYKNEQFDLPNHFLDYSYIKVSDLLHYGGVKVLKWELEQKRYMEIKLDQYYLFGRDEYHYVHHLHQNLIYGFDDKQKVFMTVGYDNLGKIQRYTVSYHDINETFKQNKDVMVKVISYQQGFRRVVLCQNICKMSVKTFLRKKYRTCYAGVFTNRKNGSRNRNLSRALYPERN